LNAISDSFHQGEKRAKAGLSLSYRRADRAALRDYFVTAFKVLPSLKVTFGEQLIRVYGSTAVNTGY
jgi:hypothetical protein